MNTVALLTLLSAGLAAAADPWLGVTADVDSIFSDYAGSDLIYGLPFVYEDLEEPPCSWLPT